jgi:hypothetical protein
LNCFDFADVEKARGENRGVLRSELADEVTRLVVRYIDQDKQDDVAQFYYSLCKSYPQIMDSALHRQPQAAQRVLIKNYQRVQRLFKEGNG